jgi:hypothetical protein
MKLSLLFLFLTCCAVRVSEPKKVIQTDSPCEGVEGRSFKWSYQRADGTCPTYLEVDDSAHPLLCDNGFIHSYTNKYGGCSSDIHIIGCDTGSGTQNIIGTIEWANNGGEAAGVVSVCFRDDDKSCTGTYSLKVNSF